MEERSIDWAFDNLSFLIHFNPFFQRSIGVISLLISTILFYIVIKSTPDELVARRANVITQLVGCLLQSVIYFILQPVPLFPHRAVIFTGPLRQMGSFPCTIIFVLCHVQLRVSLPRNDGGNEVGERKERIVFVSGILYPRQSSLFLEWYSKQSFRTKSIIVTCSHVFIVLWSSISLFVSIDFNDIQTDRTLEFLQDNFALVHLRSRSISLIILGTSFTLFIVVYFFQLLYLNRGVWLQLAKLKSSISPRTWEILHHTSLLFLGISIQPIVSFIIPTAIFILLNFAVISLDSAFLLNLTVWTTIGNVVHFITLPLLSSHSYPVQSVSTSFLLNSPFTILIHFFSWTSSYLRLSSY